VVRPADVVALPPGVDQRLVAALGLSAVAAYYVLTVTGGLQAGEQVLVLGGGGMVGQAAIQLALMGGARRVIAACRSEAGRQRAVKAGASAVVALDSADVPVLAARMKEAADGPVDLVVDPLFGAPAAAALRTLRPGGVLVNLGSSAAETAPVDSSTLRSGSLRVLGYTNNQLAPEQRNEAVRLIAEHVCAGRLTADYEPVAMAGVTDAWSRQAAGTADRRIVLTI
jgi:NADPH:quinone reductase-like Zn-dependent oxidoreductase